MLQYTYKRGYLRILLSDIKVKFSLSFFCANGRNLGGCFYTMSRVSAKIFTLI